MKLIFSLIHSIVKLRFLIILQDWKVRLVVNNYMEEKKDSNIIGVRMLHLFSRVSV